MKDQSSRVCQDPPSHTTPKTLARFAQLTSGPNCKDINLSQHRHVHDEHHKHAERSQAKVRPGRRPQSWPCTSPRDLRAMQTESSLRAIELTNHIQQQVTVRQPKPRVSRMKGHLSKRTQFVREVVREVSGYVHIHEAQRCSFSSFAWHKVGVEADC